MEGRVDLSSKKTSIFPRTKKTLPEREGGPLAVGEFAPGAGQEFPRARTTPTRPKTLPEREGEPLAVGEFAPGAGSEFLRTQTTTNKRLS